MEIYGGTVEAVCMSPEHDFPTKPQAGGAFIGEFGIPGDAHSGPTRESFTRPGTFKENDRPISIVSAEVLEEMNKRFGLDMQPGAFNEQVLIRGMGDLGQVAIGSRVEFEGGVGLEVVDRAWPCKKLADFHGEQGLIKALATRLEDGETYSRRGILAKVLETGWLSSGAAVRITTPARPAD